MIHFFFKVVYLSLIGVIWEVNTLSRMNLWWKQIGAVTWHVQSSYGCCATQPSYWCICVGLRKVPAHACDTHPRGLLCGTGVIWPRHMCDVTSLHWWSMCGALWRVLLLWPSMTQAAPQPQLLRNICPVAKHCCHPWLSLQFSLYSGSQTLIQFNAITSVDDFIMGSSLWPSLHLWSSEMSQVVLFIGLIMGAGKIKYRILCSECPILLEKSSPRALVYIFTAYGIATENTFKCSFRFSSISLYP